MINFGSKQEGSKESKMLKKVLGFFQIPHKTPINGKIPPKFFFGQNKVLNITNNSG